MVITTAADIAGDNAVHALGAAGAQARYIWLTAVGGVARFGDLANVAVGQGVELAAGVQYQFKASEADRVDYISLDKVACYIPSGTTLTRTFGI
jgi:hypothetical protein